MNLPAAGRSAGRVCRCSPLPGASVSGRLSGPLLERSTSDQSPRDWDAVAGTAVDSSGESRARGGGAQRHGALRSGRPSCNAHMRRARPRPLRGLPEAATPPSSAAGGLRSARGLRSHAPRGDDARRPGGRLIGDVPRWRSGPVPRRARVDLRVSALILCRPIFDRELPSSHGRGEVQTLPRYVSRPASRIPFSMALGLPSARRRVSVRGEALDMALAVRERW